MLYKIIVFLYIYDIVLSHNFYRVDDNFAFLIRGGEVANISHHINHYASIRTNHHIIQFGDNHLCGATIISPTIIITAAHCLRYSNVDKVIHPDDLRVVTGTYYRCKNTTYTLVSEIRRVKTHPDYKAKDLVDDIGLIVLKEPLRYNAQTEHTGLPLNDEPLKPGTKCIILGYGRVLYNGPLSPVILYAEVSVWDMENCKRVFSMLGGSGFFCAGDDTDFEKDACTGDSGGPLICDGKLAGVVSFGLGCGTRGFPGVYTNIYQYRRWLIENRAAQLYIYSDTLIWCFMLVCFCMA